MATPSPLQRRLTIAWMGVVASLLDPVAWARAQPVAAPGETLLSFDIAAQPLDSALAQYFRRTGVQLLYDSALTAGRRSSEVHGTYTQREALRRLLIGTGLRVRYSRSNAAILTRDVTAEASPLVPIGRVVVRERIAIESVSWVERAHYYRVLEQALRLSLRNDASTARLTFKMVMTMRVDPAGRVTDLDLDTGSGDRATDRAVRSVLSSAPAPPPPRALPQPLLVALSNVRR